MLTAYDLEQIKVLIESFGFAKKSDLERFATKDDLQQMKTEILTETQTMFDNGVKDIFEFIGDLHENTDGRINNHEKRLSKLEKKHSIINDC